MGMIPASRIMVSKKSGSFSPCSPFPKYRALGAYQNTCEHKSPRNPPAPRHFSHDGLLSVHRKIPAAIAFIRTPGGVEPGEDAMFSPIIMMILRALQEFATEY